MFLAAIAHHYTFSYNPMSLKQRKAPALTPSSQCGMFLMLEMIFPTKLVVSVSNRLGVCARMWGPQMNLWCGFLRSCSDWVLEQSLTLLELTDLS